MDNNVPELRTSIAYLQLGAKSSLTLIFSELYAQDTSCCGRLSSMRALYKPARCFSGPDLRSMLNCSDCGIHIRSSKALT